MISTRLVHQVEDHWEAISGLVIRRIRSAAELPQLQVVPDSDLREACRRLLSNLGQWLIGTSDREFALTYQQIGRKRCQERIALCETVRAMQLMREETINYIQDQGLVQTTVDVFAEEELERRLTVFFDLLTFHMVLGYENELREHANQATMTAGRPR